MSLAETSISPGSDSLDSPSLLEIARTFAPQIYLVYEQIEADRRLPPALVTSLAEAGLFGMLVPHALDGLETDVVTMLQVFEELAKIDGSVGWCTMIGATGGLVSAYLPENIARTIYGSDPYVITGGALAPTGKAVAVDGGYRVSGRWQFNSGCQHCSWLMGALHHLRRGHPS